MTGKKTAMDPQEQNEIDASMGDEVLLEEGTHEDDGSVGLELDARQSAEIRQIFLTTLPDYLEPVRQMVEQLVGEDDPEIKRALTTTLASMAAAAKRVGIDDVQRTLETLREDCMLIGDSAEPQEALRARIDGALAELGQLAGESSPDASKNRSETIVAAFRQLPGIDRAALQKLVASGLVFVDQLLNAETSEIAAVSGLSAAEVEKIVAALRGVREAPEEPALPETAIAEPAPATAADAAVSKCPDYLQTEVEAELALDETRGRVLSLRLEIRALRAGLRDAEARRRSLDEELASARKDVLQRVEQLTRIQTRHAGLEREASLVQAEFERISARLATLSTERQRVAEEQARLANEVALLARHVDSVVHTGSSSETPRTPESRAESRQR